MVTKKISLPLEKPEPNFELLVRILKRREEPDKVHFVELGVDYEVMKFITDNLMDPKMRRLPTIDKSLKLTGWQSYLVMHVNFYYRMGYDVVPLGLPIPPMPRKYRETKDTAILSRGKRIWIEEGIGIISSWEDFEKYPWHLAENAPIEEHFSFISEILPDGMKVAIATSLYEHVGENLLGRVGLFKSLYTQPDLVKAVFDKWGSIIYELYKRAITFDCVGVIFHCDDLGHRTGLDLRPEVLRKLVFPWYKRYAELAHNHGKEFWFHSCGKVLDIVEDLISYVGIDAFHSFQDIIIPVWKFKEMFGDRVGVLGGVDVDKLARYDESSLRKYVRFILDKCMPGGGYALGSGNTVTNYVPVRNYLIMLEEGLKWKGAS
ncbi:MAG: hypothetical protein DRZ82_01650 [Thermoprotei archaeon]|nr:MAG: hypothetical protein DRZ82_01650 [Thermoprotei archaeon]